MDDATTGQVSAQAAEVYERFFVPALFDQWPERLMDLAQVAVGHRVLDVGCGTGVLARAAYDVVQPGGGVAGVDLNAGRRPPSTCHWRAAASTGCSASSR